MPSNVIKSPFARLALALAVAGSCLAMAPDDNKEAQTQLRDFIHYTRISRYDLAAANGQALLDRLPAPYGKAEGDKAMKLTDFVKMVEASGELARFEQSAGSGQRVGELEAVASKLLKAYEQGKLDMARDAAEITKSISLLTGTQTQRMYARERLAAAGEYAMPQLIQALQKKSDVALTGEVRALLIDMRRQSIAPLVSALPSVPPTLQETIAGILGEIPYKTSLAALYELAATTQVDAVRNAAMNAINRINYGEGGFVSGNGASVAAMYEALGEAYYAKQSSLLLFPHDETQPVWNFDPASGLSGTPVRTELFNTMMAMRSAERALVLDPSNKTALALWVAANFRREIDTPKEYANPLYGADRRDAMYYAVAAGPSICQRVLARAIDTKDTPLARKAIAALQKTAGAAALAAAENNRRPLLEALRYPNRRVQVEAALALASAQPQTTFDGADRVVPILASAIREPNSKYAVILSNKGEAANAFADQLKPTGFTVFVGTQLSDVADAVAGAPGVDLVIVALPNPSTLTAVAEARASSKLAAAPILAFSDAQGAIDLNSALEKDLSFRAARSGIDAAAVTESIKQLSEKAAGEPMTAEDAAAYQGRALTALRDLAISANPVFSVADAAGPLTSALRELKGPVRTQVADVLSRINDRRVQVALADAALAAEGEEMTALLGKSTDAAKRFGNLLEDRQVKRLIELAGSAQGDQATAVAALLGSLNLSNDGLVPLITGRKKV
ncbi:MAG: hypothetical protein ACREJO_11120 [Phycisphaerales bacterium]